MDEFLVDKLETLSYKECAYYEKLFASRIESLISEDEVEADYRNTKKELERTQLAISNQIRNMREAKESLRKYLQDDVDALSTEAERLEAELARIETARSDNRRTVEELGEVRKILFSFSEMAKGASPEELTTLINSVVERIYITTEGDTRMCLIFVKGCTKEDYEDLFGADGHIETAPDAGAVQPSSFLCDLEGDRQSNPSVSFADSSLYTREP